MTMLLLFFFFCSFLFCSVFSHIKNVKESKAKESEREREKKKREEEEERMEKEKTRTTKKCAWCFVSSFFRLFFVGLFLCVCVALNFTQQGKKREIFRTHTPL